VDAAERKTYRNYWTSLPTPTHVPSRPKASLHSVRELPSFEASATPARVVLMFSRRNITFPHPEVGQLWQTPCRSLARANVCGDHHGTGIDLPEPPDFLKVAAGKIGSLGGDATDVAGSVAGGVPTDD
jgi:hypothetical protein